jgi:KinB signaling pathway activation protein
MTFRRFLILVLSTVAIGLVCGYVTTLTGLLGQVRPFRGLITGGFVSATSLMGFWAYLTLNFIMRGFITFRAWLIIQVVLIVVVFVDMVVLRHDISGPNDGYGAYLLFAAWPLAISAIVAWIKSKLSGWKSFIPALFYLYVFTVIEWIPGLNISNELNMQIQMGFVLLACNTFLLLILGKIIVPAKKTRTDG